MNDHDRELGDWPALVESFRASARAGASRPEAFWARQHGSIRERLARPGAARPRWLWTAATAAAMLLCAGALELRRAGRIRPEAAHDFDRELVYDVERTVRRDLPAALEPAALLTGELVRLIATPGRPAREDERPGALRLRAGDSKLTQRSKS
jgi:hypothetical protein